MKNIDIDTKIINSAIKTVNSAMNDANVHAVSDKTKDFVSKVINSSTEVIDNFLKTRTQKIQTRDTASKLYRYENVILCRADGRTSYNLEQNLNLVKEFGIAPRFVHYFELGRDDFLTIMEISDKNLVPYYQAADKVPEKVKQEFVSNVKNLYQNKHIVNKELFANKDGLFVSEDTGNIVYADWNQIHFLSPEDKKGMAGFIKDWHI